MKPSEGTDTDPDGLDDSQMFPVPHFLDLAILNWREDVEPSDVDRVRVIVQSSGFFSPEEVSVAVELVQERLNKGVGSGYLFFFVEVDGLVMGYSCFGPIGGTEASFDLYWIAVHDRLRGMGLGKVLLERSERRMTELGAKRIYVDTSSRAQYEPTRAFYMSCGYMAEAVLKDFYSSGDDKVIFVKVIDPVSDPKK